VSALGQSLLSLSDSTVARCNACGAPQAPQRGAIHHHNTKTGQQTIKVRQHYNTVRFGSRTMCHLQHPLLHVLSLSHDTPSACASGIVQVTHGSLLHDVDTARCASQHAMCVHDVRVAVVEASQLYTAQVKMRSVTKHSPHNTQYCLRYSQPRLRCAVPVCGWTECTSLPQCGRQCLVLLRLCRVRQPAAWFLAVLSRL